LILGTFFSCAPLGGAIKNCKKPTCIKLVSAELKNITCNKYWCISNTNAVVEFKNNTSNRLFVKVTCVWSFDGKNKVLYKEFYTEPHEKKYIKFFVNLGIHKSYVDVVCKYHAKKVN
jgi:hypothetical protein